VRQYAPFAVLIAMSIALPVAAQSGSGKKAGPRAGWHPHEFFTDDKVPAADRAIVEKNLGAAEALVARIPGYAAPRGFEITPWWAFHSAKSREHLRDYQLQLKAHVPTRYAAGGGWSPAIQIRFNPDVRQLSVGDAKEANGQSIYFERPRSAVAYGATAVYGTFGETNAPGMHVLFTSHDESPMLPVSRERYLRAVIFEFEGNDPEELKLQKQLAAQTGRSSPGDQIRAQIAAMTPEERASQGWVIARQLVPAGTPGAQALVKENPAFYRARASPFEPRAIVVYMPHEIYEKVMGATQLQLYREFDWAALKRLLDKRP
jgi:hypothetical protein